MDDAATYLTPPISVVAADYDDIGRKPKVTQRAMETHGLLGLIGDLGLDNQEIDVAVRIGLAPGVGAEQDHLRVRRSGSQAASRLGNQSFVDHPQMRPTRIELATSGLKDRRSLVPVKGPLTTELRAPCSVTLSA